MLRSVITVLLICATSLVQAAEIEATLEWANRRVAAFAVTGVVDKVLIAAGESVKKGQLLAQLDQSPFVAMVKKQQALVIGIKPRLFDAKQNYSQAQELYDRTVLSQVELHRAEAQFQGIEAEQTAAKAELDMVKWQQQQSVLRAPCECLILANRLLPGAVINTENQAIINIELAEVGLMHAVIVLEPTMQLQMQQALNVAVAGKKYAATIVTLSMENGKRLARVQFRPDAAQKLYAGQPAKVVY